MTSQQSQSHYHSGLMQMVLLWTPFLMKLLSCYVFHSNSRMHTLFSYPIITDVPCSICHLGWVVMLLGMVWNQGTEMVLGNGQQILNLSSKGYNMWGIRCSGGLDWGSAQVKIWTSDHQRMLDDWFLSLVTELALKPISQCEAFNLSVLFLLSISVLSLPLSLIVLSIL